MVQLKKSSPDRPKLLLSAGQTAGQFSGDDQNDANRLCRLPGICHRSNTGLTAARMMTDSGAAAGSPFVGILRDPQNSTHY